MYFRRHSRWKSVSFQRRYRGLKSAKMPYIYYKFCYVRSPNQDGAKTRGRVYFQLSYVMSSRRFKLSFWQCSSKALYKIDRICSSNSTRQQVRLKRCVDLFPVSSLPLTQGQVVYLKKKVPPEALRQSITRLVTNSFPYKDVREIAVVTLQTFYLGKLDLLTVYLGKLSCCSVTNFSSSKVFNVWSLDMS